MCPPRANPPISPGLLTTLALLSLLGADAAAPARARRTSRRRAACGSWPMRPAGSGGSIMAALRRRSMLTHLVSCRASRRRVARAETGCASACGGTHAPGFGGRISSMGRVVGHDVRAPDRGTSSAPPRRDVLGRTSTRWDERAVRTPPCARHPCSSSFRVDGAQKLLGRPAHHHRTLDDLALDNAELVAEAPLHLGDRFQ